MTKYFVDNAGNYIGGFDGANPPAGAVEVPFAPATSAHVWNGGGFDLPQAVLAAEESAKAKAELAAIDLASIPLLRAYIASKADAPQELNDLESAAALKKKAKVK